MSMGVCSLLLKAIQNTIKYKTNKKIQKWKWYKIWYKYNLNTNDTNNMIQNMKNI